MKCSIKNCSGSALYVPALNIPREGFSDPDEHCYQLMIKAPMCLKHSSGMPVDSILNDQNKAQIANEAAGRQLPAPDFTRAYVMAIPLTFSSDGGEPAHKDSINSKLPN